MAIDPKDFSIHDEVLVEAEVDGEPLSLSSFVTNVLPEELWLAPHVPDPRLNGLQPGQLVHLTFDRGGALVVESVLLRRLGGSAPPYGVTVRVPSARVSLPVVSLNV
jgi:hypothetical protein